eukprot:scaffold352671_cov41-Prasinocladus_malaysianus.AAC.1
MRFRPSPASPLMNVAVQTDGALLLSEAQREKKRMQKELESLTAEAGRWQAESEQAKREAEMSKAETEELRRELEASRAQRAARDEQFHGAMLGMAKRCSRATRDLTDARLQQESLRLGCVGVQRAGAMLSE